MTTIREKKKASTREALLAAARKLFTKQGFQKTTVEDIAEKAVVSKFTFYQYFNSKDEVLDELHSAGIEKALACSESLLNKGLKVAEVLEQLVSNFADFYEGDKEFARVFFSQRRIPLNSDRKSDKCLADLIALIKTGQDSGEFSKEGAAEDIARYMYVIALSEKISWIEADCSYPLKAKTVGAVKMLLHGLLKQTAK